MNNRSRTLRTAFFIGLMEAALLESSPALAHHSFAQFEMGKDLSVSGVVKSFEWTNPHTWLTLDVRDSVGANREWKFEGASVVELARSGWTSHVLKAGDTLTVHYHPLHGGRPGGAFFSINTADGRVLDQSTPKPAADAAS